MYVAVTDYNGFARFRPDEFSTYNIQAETQNNRVAEFFPSQADEYRRVLENQSALRWSRPSGNKRFDLQRVN
jgi:hypothetical protein